MTGVSSIVFYRQFFKLQNLAQETPQLSFSAGIFRFIVDGYTLSYVNMIRDVIGNPHLYGTKDNGHNVTPSIA